MGVPRLHIKKELNYRRGTADRLCSGCAHYVANPAPLVGFRATNDGRCRIIGLKPGRAYQILPGNVCDKHEKLAG